MKITHCDPARLREAAVEDHPADKCLEAYCDRCQNVVDAVCPGCRSNVSRSGATMAVDVSAGSCLSRSEFYRRLANLVMTSRNGKFTFGCYLIATGDAYADGVSMTEFARAWGVGKAAVSKQCRTICAMLGIEPSQYMRKEGAAAKFRSSNRRPQKANET